LGSGVQPLALKIFRGLSPSYDRVLTVSTFMQDAYWKTWLLRHAGIRDTKTILDLGCGTGILEERLPGSAQVVGVDITEEMVRRAQSKAIPSLKMLTLGDGEHMPFRDGSFDTVVSCYVVKYCSPARLAKEMARVLRKGGTLVLYDFTRPRGALAPILAGYTYGILKIVGLATRLFDPATALTYLVLPDVIRSSVWDDNFEEVLRAAGFSPVGSRRLTGGVVTGFWASKQ